jgi:hypothetical protein
MPLVAGRYPTANEEWMLDGQPSPPYRRTISRGDITVSTISIASTAMTVYPIVAQPGDIFGAVSLLVKTATATPSHSWAALYSGVGATATLLTQSADVTGGWAVNAQKVSFANPYLVGSPPGGTGTTGPVVLGLALYASGGATVFDGMAGSAVAGAVAVTG